MPRNKNNSSATITSGYIVLDRAIFSHWIANDANTFFRWIDLIRMANWKDKNLIINGQLVMCKRGEFITSLSKLSEQWKVSRDTTRNFINLLTKDHMLYTRTTKHYTHITICNYDTYQLIPHTYPQPNAQLTPHEPTTKRTQTDTTEEYNKVINNFKYTTQQLEAFIKNQKSKITLPGGAAQAIEMGKKELTRDGITQEEYNYMAPLVVKAQQKFAAEQSEQYDKEPAELLPEENYPPQRNALTYWENTLSELEKELMQSEEWHTKIQMDVLTNRKIEISKDEIKEKIPQFIKHISTQDTFPVTLKDKKKHFLSWIKIVVTSNSNSKKNERPVAKRKSDAATNLTSSGINPDTYGKL